jgi:hypothetical protein
VIGMKTLDMGMVSKHGLTVLGFRDNGLKGGFRVVFMYSQMDLSTLVNSIPPHLRWKAKEF